MNILNELEKEVSSDAESCYYYQIYNQITEISAILRKKRLEKNITQIEIARKTGLSKQMVSKIESYNGNPTLLTLVKYCDCIGVDLVDALKR